MVAMATSVATTKVAVGVLLVILLDVAGAWQINLNCGGKTPVIPGLPDNLKYYDGVYYGPGTIYNGQNALIYDGLQWDLDGFYSGASVHSIERPDGDGVYETERYALSMEYLILVPPPPDGKIFLKFYFREARFEIDAPGKRVFSISVNDQQPPALQHIDLVGQVGYGNPLEIEETVHLDFGNLLAIKFTSQAFECMCNGISIRSAADLNFGNPVNFYPTSFSAGPGSDQYIFNLARGVYSVTLTFTAPTTAGTQTFVYFNFLPVLYSVDLCSLAGGCGATVTITKSFVCTNGLFRLQLRSSSGGVNLQGITGALTADGGDGSSVLYTINAGSPIDVLDIHGTIFKADHGYTGGEAVSPNPYEVYGGNPGIYPYYWSDFVLTTWRRESSPTSPFSYVLSIPNGNWAIAMFFADDVTASGQRVFDVAVQGQPFFTGIDIFALTGCKFCGLILQAYGTVTDGTLTLTFSASVGTAILNALTIYQESTFGSPVSFTSSRPSAIAAPVGGTVVAGGWIAPGGGPTTCYTPNPVPAYSYSTPYFAVECGGGQDYISTFGINFVADLTPCLQDGSVGGDNAAIPSGNLYCRTNIVIQTGGYSYDSPVPVAGTTDAAIFETERIGFNTYKFLVTPGASYAVILYFAEIASYNVGLGQRVLSVPWWSTIDSPVGNDKFKQQITGTFDQFAAACNQMFVAAPPVQGVVGPMESNVLSLQFYPAGGIEAPVVKGIWIYKL